MFGLSFSKDFSCEKYIDIIDWKNTHIGVNALWLVYLPATVYRLPLASCCFVFTSWYFVYANVLRVTLIIKPMADTCMDLVLDWALVSISLVSYLQLTHNFFLLNLPSD